VILSAAYFGYHSRFDHNYRRYYCLPQTFPPDT
jgi:hypothetical protein